MTSKNLEVNRTGELVTTHYLIEKYQKKWIEKMAKKAKVSEAGIVRGVIDEAME